MLRKNDVARGYKLYWNCLIIKIASTTFQHWHLWYEFYCQINTYQTSRVERFKLMHIKCVFELNSRWFVVRKILSLLNSVEIMTFIIVLVLLTELRTGRNQTIKRTIVFDEYPLKAMNVHLIFVLFFTN